MPLNSFAIAAMETKVLPSRHAAPFLNNELVLKKDAPLSSLLDSTHNSHREHVPVPTTPDPTTLVPTTDPRIDDAPQLGSYMEWYYLQAHIRDGSSTISEDPRHSVFVCVFRQTADTELEPTVDHNWAVIYATLDWETQKYVTYSKVPPSTPKYLSKSLEGNHSALSKAIQNMVNGGPNGKDVPSFAPDELFSNPLQIRQHAKGEGPALHLDWDNGASLAGENGSYHLKVPEIELDIQVHASKPMMLHGHNGETLENKKVCVS